MFHRPLPLRPHPRYASSALSVDNTSSNNHDGMNQSALPLLQRRIEELSIASPESNESHNSTSAEQAQSTNTAQHGALDLVTRAQRKPVKNNRRRLEHAVEQRVVRGSHDVDALGRNVEKLLSISDSNSNNNSPGCTTSGVATTTGSHRSSAHGEVIAVSRPAKCLNCHETYYVTFKLPATLTLAEFFRALDFDFEAEYGAFEGED